MRRKCLARFLVTNYSRSCAGLISAVDGVSTRAVLNGRTRTSLVARSTG